MAKEASPDKPRSLPKSTVGGVQRRKRNGTPLLLLAPAGAVFLILLVLPLIYLLWISLLPPAPNAPLRGSLSLDSYIQLGDPYFAGILWRTLRISGLVTLLCLILGYPVAISITRSHGLWRTAQTILVISPLFVSVVVRAYGWLLMLGNRGVINGFLTWAGLQDRPTRFLSTEGAVIVGLAESMLPFMVNMARLYELFVSEWLRKNLRDGIILKAQETIKIGDSSALQFRIDMLLLDGATGEARYVLDTKYKTHGSPGSDDVAQVVAYATAKRCKEAILIYPARLGSPLDDKVGDIRVRSLTFPVDGDLDQAGEAFLESLLGWQLDLNRRPRGCRSAQQTMST